jgi:FMN phosphatase YigB (HAD superfamily)
MEKQTNENEGFRMKQKIIIVDLDGTLCNADHRRHFVESEKKDWNGFYENMTHDEPNEWCLEIMDRFKASEIVFVTGRPEKYRDITKAWLTKKCGYGTRPLFMRKNNDFRPDFMIKTEIYKEHIEPEYQVMFCVDDRKQVVDAWRELGLICLQCADGNF